ncbi:hypothetical protein Tco_1530938 [Tanacetum coccineum]
MSSTHCGNKSILRVLRIILVILPEHPSETKVLHNEDGNPARANIKQALGSYERSHKGVKASANSDIVYFFTSAQDGDPLQDDIIMANPPPPNHAADLPKDEPVHPEPTPVILFNALAQPEGYISDEEPEEEPEQEPEFASLAQAAQDNMNSWLEEEDDKDEMEAEEGEEVDDMEDDEIDVDNDKDDVEVIHPCEEADPLNRPPPNSDEETVFARATAPVTISRHGPLGCNMEILRSKVKTLDKQMYDRYTTESKMLKRSNQSDLRMNGFDYDISVMDSALREHILNHSKMVQLVKDLSKQFQECRKEEDIREENMDLREMLRIEFCRYRSARVSWDYDQLSY